MTRQKSSKRVPDITAMSAIFERHAATLNEHVDVLEAEPGQVGAIFSMGGSSFSLDFFDNSSTFEAFLLKLIRSYAVDTLRRGSGRTKFVKTDAAAFVQDVIVGKYDDHLAVGLGTDVGIVGDGIVAGALVHNDTVVHLAAFSEPQRFPELPVEYPPYQSRHDFLRSGYS